jgi:hypothetical protein
MKKLFFLFVICACTTFGQEIHLGMNKPMIDSILSSIGYFSNQRTYFPSLTIPYCSKTDKWINYTHSEENDKRIFRNGKTMTDAVLVEIDKDFINWLVNYEHVNRELDNK